jgi:3'(2'), 5'-bisphosphate nucleotidase
MVARLILLCIYLMLTSLNGLRRTNLPRVVLHRRFTAKIASTEYLFVAPEKDASTSRAVAQLQSLRPHIKLIQMKDKTQKDLSTCLWSVFRDGLQLDATILQPHFLGKHQLSDEETAAKWMSAIMQRLDFATNPQSLPYMDGGNGLLREELQTAISIVQRSAFLIRSLQKKLLSQADFSGETKNDKTPVTVADLSVQALIIDTLSAAFPNDRFIAEEDSGLVRTSADIRNTALSVLSSATGETWDADRLYVALDKGSKASVKTPDVEQRVWVLDPIDGTKGFLRGEHCCTGLGLLIQGKTALSVLGCPNLNLPRLLERDGSAVIDIGTIDAPLRTDSQDIPLIPHPDCGSLYYAVTGQGAFARALAMPHGAAYEVTTSGVSDASRAVLCESAEAAFGDRRVSARTSQLLGAIPDFVRIDGKTAWVYLICTCYHHDDVVYGLDAIRRKLVRHVLLSLSTRAKF